MTAVQAPGAGEGLSLRRLHDALARPNREARTLMSGRPVRFRLAQMTLWSAVTAVLGASFIAGVYFGLFEVNWRIFDLKAWWDGGAGIVHSSNWVLYRHGAFRDIAEPAIATMAVRTLLAKPAYWDVRVGAVRLLTAPLLVLALTFGLGIAGIWAVDFGLPDAWAHVTAALGHPGFKVSAHFLGKGSVPQLVLGILIGQVVHRVWAPVGATLQGFVLDRSVDRATASGRVPLWEREPLMPPVVRERFALMYRTNASVDVRPSHRLLIRVVLAFMALVTVLGLIGHYWIGTGHPFPFLAS